MNATNIGFPDAVTREQVTAALRALGLEHLENDTEAGLMLREVHMTPGEITVVVMRNRSAGLHDDISTVTARIGYARPRRP